MVDYAKPAPLFPNSCTILAERILETTSELHENSLIVDLKREDGKLPPLNQLTINEYLPGQGIASHTGKALVLISNMIWHYLHVTRY